MTSDRPLLDPAGSRSSENSGSAATYRVYAVRYAMNPTRTRNGAFVRDLDPTEPLGIDFYFWVAISDEEVVVIDTGMAAELAARQGHTLVIDPIAALSKLGIAPADVKTVVMTHLHYDHAGNTDAFPNATFHLQAEEMAFVTGPLMAHRWLRHAYSSAEIQRFVGYLHDDRLRLHGREAEIADGMTVHWVGGHSLGQEVVRIRTESGWLVLASDALHYGEELTRGIPYALSANNVDMLASHERIRQLAGQRGRIIPGHDPLVIKEFPVAVEGLEGIAVRVDAV